MFPENSGLKTPQIIHYFNRVFFPFSTIHFWGETHPYVLVQHPFRGSVPVRILCHKVLLLLDQFLGLNGTCGLKRRAPFRCGLGILGNDILPQLRWGVIIYTPSLKDPYITRWWFQTFFMFIPIWGR